MVSENYEVSKLLIEKGADVNYKNVFAKTALFYIVSSFYDNRIISLLLNNGANVNEKDYGGNTPIMYVPDIIKLQILIDNGADIEAENEYGWTALSYATSIETVKILLDNGAKMTHGDPIGTYIIEGLNPTWDLDPFLEMIEALLERGAPIIDKDGNDYLIKDDWLRKNSILGKKVNNLIKKYMTRYIEFKKIIESNNTSKNFVSIVEALENKHIKNILDYKPKYFTDTQYIQILNDYAYFLSETDRYKEAIPILERVIELSPNRVVAYLNLGDCYYKDYKKSKKQSDKEKVVENYKKYVSLLKKDAKIPDRVKEILEIK